MTQLSSNSFPGANGALGSPFSPVTGNPANFAIASHIAIVTSLGSDCVYRETSITWAPDHYAEVTYSSVDNTAPNHGYGPAVRCDIGGSINTYCRGTGSGAGFEVVQMLAGTLTVLESSARVTFTGGDVFGLLAVGTTLFAYKNGSTFGTYTISATGGAPGIAYSSTASSGGISLWAAGVPAAATADLLQETVPTSNGGIYTTTVTSNALPNNATIGSTLEFWIATEQGVPITSVIDSAGQNYSVVGSVNDPSDNSELLCYQFPNNGSATQLTATVITGTSSNATNVQLREIGGITTAGVIASDFVKRVSPGTAPDAIVASAAVSGPGPFFISACGIGILIGSSPAAGDGFAGTVGFPPGHGFTHSLFESARTVATGTLSATYTDTLHGGSESYLVGMVVYAEVPSGGAGVVGSKRRHGRKLSPLFIRRR